MGDSSLAMDLENAAWPLTRQVTLLTDAAKALREDRGEDKEIVDWLDSKAKHLPKKRRVILELDLGGGIGLREAVRLAMLRENDPWLKPLK